MRTKRHSGTAPVRARVLRKTWTKGARFRDCALPGSAAAVTTLRPRGVCVCTHSGGGGVIVVQLVPAGPRETGLVKHGPARQSLARPGRRTTAALLGRLCQGTMAPETGNKRRL